MFKSNSVQVDRYLSRVISYRSLHRKMTRRIASCRILDEAVEDTIQGESGLWSCLSALVA